MIREASASGCCWSVRLCCEGLMIWGLEPEVCWEPLARVRTLSHATLPTAAGSTDEPSPQVGGPQPGSCLALVILWSRDEPERVGEITLLKAPSGEPPGWTLGRGNTGDGVRTRLNFMRQRPGRNLETGPLLGRRISRVQLGLTPSDGGRIALTAEGQRQVRLGGRVVKQAVLAPGELIEVEDELLLMLEPRSTWIQDDPNAGRHRFGYADAFGLVGETPAAWELRRQLTFVGPRGEHALILGASGVGKELIAQAVHALSDRGDRPLIARNAATFPETLIDAELFGNAVGYPNPGMAERPGLIGQADRGTLFLDEIGELSRALQAHLLRVLDAGEYQRLGDSSSRRSDFRLLAATNRDPKALKHDLRARMAITIQVPGLEARRADIPLLIRHLLRVIGERDPAIADRFLDERGQPRVTPGLMSALVCRPYTAHVRELRGLLWTVMLHARGELLEESQELRFQPEEASTGVDPSSLTRAALVSALEAAEGVRERAWRALGLRSRHQLNRLMKKHDLT